MATRDIERKPTSVRIWCLRCFLSTFCCIKFYDDDDDDISVRYTSFDEPIV